MNQTPADGGRQGHAEYLVDSAVQESRNIADTELLEELDKFRIGLEAVITTVHKAYHSKGVAKPPTWDHCHRSTCRTAQLLLLKQEDKGVNVRSEEA